MTTHADAPTHATTAAHTDAPNAANAPTAAHADAAARTDAAAHTGTDATTGSTRAAETDATASAPHADAEQVIGEFYSEFPYPWHATRLTAPDDPALHPSLLSQELGDFTHRRIPPGARVWVPGCGVNQALIVALRFPDAEVVGSDVSTDSLDLCRTARDQVGASNLTLREEGISDAPYRQEFDYVVCTGVIHHHPEPGMLLARLAAALKPSGVLELMVYNAYHRREITAFQEAMRLLGREQDLWFARRVAGSLTRDSELTRQLRADLGEPEEQFADSWLNPCERNFTVRTLHETARAAGLALEAPCASPLATGLDLYDWRVPCADAQLRRQADGLDDTTRWQVTQALSVDRSPLLWFYLRRDDNPLPALREVDRDEAFLDTAFVPVEARERVWVMGRTGGYRALEEPQPLVTGPASALPWLPGASDGERTVRELLADRGEVPSGDELRDLRIRLTTPSFPYLRAVTGP
ncbi:class I SAM-dependent methyltransferase [Streptomyces sp. NPDC001941]|uniref:class I SAM-dependent methyltransferase n=1 Tax=Streptomyces sp. NPDC001941 TaxID=3154659 RepID=UPI0033333918